MVVVLKQYIVILGCEDIAEVVIDSGCKLLRSCRYGAIQVVKVGDLVASSSFEDGLVEKEVFLSPLVAQYFFVSLPMEDVLFGKDNMVLMSEFSLD